MRALIAALVLSVGLSAVAAPPFRPPRLRPLDAAGFAELVQAMKGEGFPDGKLAQLRAVAMRRLTLTCAQVITVLGLFDFWRDRGAAVREVVIGDPANVGQVLRYFDGAPYDVQRDVRAVLGGS